MPGPIVSRPLLKKLVVAALATLTITGSLVFQSGSRIQGDLIPSVNNTYTLGATSTRWLATHSTSVSSTNITATGYVSTTALYVDGGNGNYVTFDPRNRYIAYAAYGNPSIITFFPFSDGNNYMRGTTTYIQNTLQSESNTAWRITSAGAVSSTTLNTGGSSLPSGVQFSAIGSAPTTTVQFGASSTNAGCIRFGDTDKDGFTYCQANNGSLICSLSPCS